MNAEDTAYMTGWRFAARTVNNTPFESHYAHIPKANAMFRLEAAKDAYIIGDRLAFLQHCGAADAYLSALGY